ncbi:MAG: M48 family metalloprotease [Acidobacteriota bacterium]
MRASSLHHAIFFPLLVLSLASSPAFARRPGDPLKPGFNLFTKDQDAQLGKEAALEVSRKYQTVDNRFLQDYVTRIGNRLAATQEARDSGFPFRFTMIVEPGVNAFALPGGPMFIQTGLFTVLDNEAQLAGVMAHEMSHVILRHGTHEATKAKGIGMVAALAQAAVGDSSTMARVLDGAISLGANSWMLHYSRDAESEADALGAHLMAEAGWDPAQLAVFFRKLNASASPGAGARALQQFLSDHPNPENRDLAIQLEAKALPRRSYGYSTGDFVRARKEALQISIAPPARPAPRQ